MIIPNQDILIHLLNVGGGAPFVDTDAPFEILMAQYLPQAFCLLTLFLPFWLPRVAVVISIPLALSILTVYANVYYQWGAFFYVIPSVVFILSFVMFIKACLDGDLI